jgi:predicted dinucleotide-utilizing enzyme
LPTVIQTLKNWNWQADASIIIWSAVGQSARFNHTRTLKGHSKLVYSIVAVSDEHVVTHAGTCSHTLFCGVVLVAGNVVSLDCRNEQPSHHFLPMFVGFSFPTVQHRRNCTIRSSNNRTAN